MNLRERLNRNPLLTAGLVVVIAATAGWVGLRGVVNPPVRMENTYFTADNGQSWFALDTRELPPIQHDGKEAVRAYLFKCQDGKPFVGYMERYTKEAKAALAEAQAARAAGNPPNAAQVMYAVTAGQQFKRPSDKEWFGGPRGSQVKTVSCADGSPIRDVN